MHNCGPVEAPRRTTDDWLADYEVNMERAAAHTVLLVTLDSLGPEGSR